jgi:hypothetical protein
MQASTTNVLAGERTMLEEIKLVGGIAGLATAAFTIWDRWARGRPLAWPTIKTFGVNPFKFIRIKNPGPRAYPAGIYGVAKNDSSDAILQATVPQIFGVADLHALLRRDAEYDLPIYYLSKTKMDLEGNLPSRRVCFLIFWRKTSSTWLPQFPVWIMTSTRDLDHMAAPDHAEQVP